MDFRKSHSRALSFTRALNGGDDPAEGNPADARHPQGNDGPADGGPAAAGPPGPGRRRGPRWLRWLGLSLRTLLLLGLLLLGALAYLLYHPWSWSPVDRLIQSKFRRATGLPLAYQRATFQIMGGEVTFERPRVIDVETSEPLVAASELRVRLPFTQFLDRGGPVVIEAIEVDGPLNVDIISNEGKLTPAGPWRRVWEHIQTRRARPSGGKAAARLERLELNQVNLRWSERLGDAPSTATQTRELFSMVRSEFDISFDQRSRPLNIIATGFLNGQRSATPSRIEISPDLEKRSAAFKVGIEGFSTQRDLARLPAGSPSAQSDRLELSGKLEPAGEAAWSLGAEATLHALTLARRPPGTGAADATASHTLALGTTRLALGLDFEPATRLVLLRRAELASDQGEARTSGTLVARAPFEYELELNPLVLKATAIEFITALWPRAGRLLPSSDGELRLAGRVRGNVRSREPDAVTGELRLAGLDWRLPKFPMPLLNLALDVALTTGSLELRNASTIVNGIPVRVQGRLRGRPLDGVIDSVDLNWTTSGNLSEVAELLKQRRRRGTVALEISGEIAGKGRLRATGPIKGKWLDALQQARLEGDVTLRNGRLEHARLARPLSKLNGRVVFEPDRARFERFSGSFDAIAFTVNGDVRGEPRFWDDPAFDVQIGARSELEPLMAIIQEQTGKNAGRGGSASLGPLEAIEGGRVILDSTLAGSVAKWQQSKVSGTLRLEDTATSLSTKAVNGRLRLAEAELAFTPEQLELRRVRGRLGELAVEASGTLTPAGGTVDSELDGTLLEAQRRLPPLLRRFIVDGEVHATNRLTLAWNGEPAASWPALIERARGTKPAGASWGAWLRERVTWSDGGTLKPRDAEMTFDIMPARLRELGGTFLYEVAPGRVRLWNDEPAPVAGGELSRGLLARIEFIRADNRPLRFTYHITGEHFALEEWLRPWKKSKTPGQEWPADQPFDAAIPPTFQLTGTAATDTASWKQVQCGNFTANLTLDSYRGRQPSMLQWTDVRGTLYGGTFESKGQMYNRKLQASYAMQGVAFPDLVKAVSNKAQVHGAFSGTIDVSGDLRRDGAGQPVAGAGQVRVIDSRFVSNSIFRGLGGVLRLPIFEDVTFSTIHGPFAFRGKEYSSDGIILENPIMNIKVSGTVHDDRTLDITVALEFLRIARDVPLVGEALDIVNSLVSRVLRFNIRGTADRPVITPL